MKNRFWLVVPLVTLVHFVVQVVSLFITITSLDKPTLYRAARVVCAITFFPTSYLLNYVRLVPHGLSDWLLIFLANSVLWALAAWLLLRIKWRPPRPGHCHHCGYNLHGATSPACPECGSATAPAKPT